MGQRDEPQRLVLWAPVGRVCAAALEAAWGAGDVAAAVLAGARADDPAVALCQRAGVAAFLTDGPVGGADGLHVAGPFEARLKAVREGGAVVGAQAVTKHEAMELGEAGAAYVWFGTPDVVESGCRALASWWTPLFEVPAVACGAASLADIDALVATGADFVALGPALLATPEAAAEAVREAAARIKAREAA